LRKREGSFKKSWFGRRGEVEADGNEEWIAVGAGAETLAMRTR